MAAESLVEESKGIAQGLVVWQSIWHGLSLSEGSDVNIFALRYQNSSLVLVCAAVVWGRENSNDGRKLFSPIPLVEFKASLFAFVGPHYGFEAFFR